MNRPELIKQLDDTLTQWERTKQWGEFQIEIKAGVPTLLRVTVQQKLSAYQLGGYTRERETRSDGS